jgi:hypothetical protein
MVGTDRWAAGDEAGRPKRRRCVILDAPDGQTNLNRQLGAKASEGGSSILLLATTLAGLAADAGRNVLDEDGGFYLVAMLPARSAPPLPPDTALLEKLLGGQRGGVGGHSAQSASEFLQHDEWQNGYSAKSFCPRIILPPFADLCTPV